MKDVKNFDFKSAFHIGWSWLDYINLDCTQALESKNLGLSIGLYSTEQLVRFLAFGGYACTMARERAVRTVLMHRIEVGDSILAVPFDLVAMHGDLGGALPAWRTVDKRNARQIRLGTAGWYSKNNICWKEMFNL